MVISDIGFARCHSDHSVFVRSTKSGSRILVVYVDDILLTGSDSVVFTETKEYLKRHFVTKDIRKPTPQTTFCDEEYGEAKIFP